MEDFAFSTDLVEEVLNNYFNVEDRVPTGARPDLTLPSPVANGAPVSSPRLATELQISPIRYSQSQSQSQSRSQSRSEGVIDASDSPHSNPGASSGPRPRKRRKKQDPAPEMIDYPEVTVTLPPQLATAIDPDGQRWLGLEWTRVACDMLPRGLLKVARAKTRAQEKFYEDCSGWKEFIERTNERSNARRASREYVPRELRNQALVVRQAQVAVYGNYVRAEEFEKWD